MSQATTTPMAAAINTQGAEATKQLNQWMFDQIQPFLRGRTLELNSGLGAISTLFVEKGITIHVSDAEKQYCDLLAKKFKGVATIRAIHKIDFHHSDFQKAHAESLGLFNIVFALNTAEHGLPDQGMIDNAKLLLPQGGLLIMVAPAYTSIFNGLDKNLGSWKIYNRESIEKTYGTDFEILKTRYFNLVGGSGHYGLSVLAIGMKK